MSFGFEAYRTDGSKMISSTDGVARLIYSSDRHQSFSGNISVPTFNSNAGYYSYNIYPFLQHYNWNTGYNVYAENSNFFGPGMIFPAQCYSRGPNLSWNNSTKILSVTPNAKADNGYSQTIKYRYRITMVHYK